MAVDLGERGSGAANHLGQQVLGRAVVVGSEDQVGRVSFVFAGHDYPARKVNGRKLAESNVRVLVNIVPMPFRNVSSAFSWPGRILTITVSAFCCCMAAASPVSSAAPSCLASVIVCKNARIVKVSARSVNGY
jgi:hypothetical protein